MGDRAINNHSNPSTRSKEIDMLSRLTALFFAFCVATQAHGISLVSTDFTGRTVAGNTASNISWTVFAVADPGDLTAVDVNSTGSLNGLFDTANAQGHFAPDLNTGNEGPWSTATALSLNVPSITVEEVVIDWQHFNNSGNFQGVNRSVDWTVNIVGSASGTIASAAANNINGTSGVETIAFGSPVMLSNDETYNVVVQATGSNGTGNNTGLDGLTINGSIPSAIIATDFDARTVAGATASNITWIANGVADPGDITASHNLFNTADAQGRIAVDRNLHNEGDWTLDIDLNVGGDNVAMATVEFDAFIFSNGGVLQQNQRDLDLTVELLDAGLNVLASESVSDVFANTGVAVQPQHVSFDFTGNTLLANQLFTLRITASGAGPGNNAGIDNLLVLANTAVPEPTSMVLISLAGAALLRRRRQAA